MIIFTPNTVIKSTEVNSNFDELLVSINPIGTIQPYAGLTEPNYWLFCYGQAISRTTYASLFSVISTTYGVGDGSTTFNLPDLRGRVIAGQDDMGGTSANRLTGLSGGVDGDILGATGGAQSHTLTIAEMPSHSHQWNAAGLGALNTTPANWDDAVGGSTNGLGVGPTNPEDAGANAIRARGGGGAHNNIQPTIILNYIIKY